MSRPHRRLPQGAKEAARRSDLGANPRDLNFKGALSHLREIAAQLHCAHGDKLIELRVALVIAIEANRVNDCPDRVEPRYRKRRPKHYPHPHASRQEAKAR